MNPASAVVGFVIIWTIVFFAVLPWGVRSRHESTPDGVEGAEEGAPANPRLFEKALVTTAIAALLFALFLLGVLGGVFDPERWPTNALYRTET